MSEPQKENAEIIETEPKPSGKDEVSSLGQGSNETPQSEGGNNGSVKSTEIDGDAKDVKNESSKVENNVVNKDSLEAKNISNSNQATNKGEADDVSKKVAADEDQQVDALKAKIASSNNKDSLSSIMGAFGGKAGNSGGMMGAFGGLKKNAAEKKEEETTQQKDSSVGAENSSTLNSDTGEFGQIPPTPQSPAVSGLFSREGISAQPSVSGMSSIGQDVDALSTLLDSMYEQDRRSAMSKRKEPITGNGARPYLDVMTVNTTQFPSAMDGETFGTHTRLLIEPISFPSLKHTGVNSELLDKVAEEKEFPNMFYPNGTKKLSLRNSIRGLLRVEPSRISMNSMSNISVDQMSSNWGSVSQNPSIRGTLTSTRNASKMSTRKYKARRSRRNRMLRKSASSSASLPGLHGRQRIGSRTRLRSRETKNVLDALHETLHFMDRAVMKA